MSKTMSIRMDRDNYEFLHEITKAASMLKVAHKLGIWVVPSCGVRARYFTISLY